MALFKELNENLLKCAQTIITVKFFNKITYLISKSNDYDLVKTSLHVIEQLFTSLTNEKDSDMVIKLINHVYQSKILTHICKNIYGHKNEIDIYKNLLSVLIENYDVCKSNCSKIKQDIFITSLSRLLLESHFTRHVIFCMIRIDTLSLLNYKEIVTFEKLLIDTIIIDKNTQNYIVDWFKNDSSNTISLLALRVLPLLICEMKKFNRSIPKDINIKLLNKLMKEFFDALNQCSESIKNLNIVQDILNLSEYLYKESFTIRDNNV